MNIEDLDFTVRTYNALKRADYKTVAELEAASDEELLAVPLFNEKCLEEVHSKMGNYKFYSLEFIKDVLKPLSKISFALWIYAMELLKEGVDIKTVEKNVVMEHLGIDKRAYYAAMNELSEAGLI